MSKYVADTMAVVLHLENRKMPPKVKNLFQQADLGKVEMLIPSIVLAEIGYLSEKGKIQLVIAQVESHLQKHKTYSEIPQNIEVVKAAFSISDIPELHDRLIAGTAKWLGHEIISNDPKIIASRFVKSIWK
jgi:predicted nucleic acid-binding protein